MNKQEKLVVLKNNINRLVLVLILIMSLTACGAGSSGCDTIANPEGPAFFKVENNLSSGLSWNFQSGYAFGADMKPGECTNMGVSPSQYTIRLQQCNIGGGACNSNFGESKTVVFSVSQGETYTLRVDNNTFD